MLLRFRDTRPSSKFVRAAVAAAAVSSAIALPAVAADMGKILLGQLDRADAIVLGKVTDVHQGTADDSPVSLVRFAVSEKIRGEVGGEIEVVVPRTLIQKGPLLLETGSQEEPALGLGDESLLFLTRYPGRDGSYSITSADNGKFVVTTTAEGEKRADRFMLSRPVVGGVPLDALLGQIRKELKIPVPSAPGSPKADVPSSPPSPEKPQAPRG